MAEAGSIDAVEWPPGILALRLASDELLLLGEMPPGAISDPYAIVERESGFSAAWLPAGEAEELLARTCAWELPEARPAFAQGAVADIPVKLYFDNDRVLFMVQSTYAADLEERLR